MKINGCCKWFVKFGLDPKPSIISYFQIPSVFRSKIFLCRVNINRKEELNCGDFCVKLRNTPDKTFLFKYNSCKGKYDFSNNCDLPSCKILYKY